MAIQSHFSRTFFTGDNIATKTYVYTAGLGNTATAGWINRKADYAVVQIGCATMLGSSFQYRIEGRSGALLRPAELYSESLATPTSIDKLIYIPEHVTDIRVGVRAGKIVSSPLASAMNVYAGLILTETK